MLCERQAGKSRSVNLVACRLPFTFPLVGTLATMTGTNSMLAIATVHIKRFSQ